MKTSDAGRKRIERFEQLRLVTYPDSRKPPQMTIGFGHAIRPGESFPNGITDDQADAIMSNDLRIAESAINSHLNYGETTQNMFDALVSLTFNEGGGAIANSTLLRMLNAGDVQGAADQFLRWDKELDNGRLVDSPGLESRRVSERAVFLTPDAPVTA